MTLTELTDILHAEGCSCVIGSRGAIVRCHRRGVADLYEMLTDRPEVLDGAMIADKVIGKGAAALMILGGAGEVYADVISRPALDLLERAGVAVSYARCVPNIINRARTGICPVEALCRDAATAADCLPLIARFISSHHS